MFKWSLSSSPDDHCTNHMRSIVGCFSHDAMAPTWLQRSKWGFDQWGMLGIPSRWERISSACIRTNNLHCWALQSLGVVDLSGMEYLHGGFNGVQKDFKTMKVNCDRNCPLSMESKGQQLKPTATWRHWRPCVGPRRNEPDPVCRRSRSWVETLETNSPPIPAVVAASSILGVSTMGTPTVITKRSTTAGPLAMESMEANLTGTLLFTKCPAIFGWFPMVSLPRPPFLDNSHWWQNWGPHW